MSFLNIMLWYYFSLEAVLQGMAKNNPTEKQSMHLIAGKARKNQLLLFESFKYLTQQTNTYAKLATVTLIQGVNLLKVNSTDCVSLVTTCKISDLLSSIFLVYYQHAFIYCDAFIVKISFSIFLLSILNRFDELSYFFFYQF